uniref:EGF-like domain-containing protein n=1 Tax=Mesocestoides corti TaxID=53468 RepID=A0A5K3FLA5_MESCO
MELRVWCLVVAMTLKFTEGTTEDDTALTMEIAIETPQGPRTEEVAALATDLGDCQSGEACQNGGQCRPSTTQEDGKIAKAVCVCPLGYSGSRCTEKETQPRFPELLDGGYIAFGGYLLPDFGPLSMRLQIKPKLLRPRTLLLFHVATARGLAFHLEVNDGNFKFRVYNQSKSGHFHLSQYLESPVKFEEIRGRFTDIEVGLRLGDQAYLLVDDREAKRHLDVIPELFEGFGIDTVEVPSISKQPIYIGGHPSLLLRNQFPLVEGAANNLIGCLGDIHFNGELVDPRRGAFVGDAIDGYGIVDCARKVCENNLCENHATCKPVSPTNYVCLCPLGTQPPWCQQALMPVIPEFVGNSYIGLRGFADTSWTDTLLEVIFYAKNPTGLLIYSGFSFDRRGDFICVALVDGFIAVSFDLGTGPSFQKSSQNISMATWHHLQVKRIGRSFNVLIDDEAVSKPTESFTHGNFVQLTITDNLLIGGHPEPDHVSALLPDRRKIVSYKGTRHFIGCIQSVCDDFCCICSHLIGLSSEIFIQLFALCV